MKRCQAAWHRQPKKVIVTQWDILKDSSLNLMSGVRVRGWLPHVACRGPCWTVEVVRSVRQSVGAELRSATIATTFDCLPSSLAWDSAHIPLTRGKVELLIFVHIARWLYTELRQCVCMCLSKKQIDWGKREKDRTEQTDFFFLVSTIQFDFYWFKWDTIHSSQYDLYHNRPQYSTVLIYRCKRINRA